MKKVKEELDETYDKHIAIEVRENSWVEERNSW